MARIKILSFFNVLIVLNLAQNSESQATQSTLYFGYYNSCDGADAANYTMLGQSTLSADCSSAQQGGENQLIQYSSSNQKSVIGLQQLARSRYPAGAYSQVETLWLATSGPLAGKYIYEKAIILTAAYLKKCSSVLGYSFVSTKSAVLLINPTLDLNVFLNPNGAYETFKKGSTTKCEGKGYMV